MKRFGYLILGLITLLLPGSAWATCTVPYTFVNGTVADGGQVSSNFTSVLGCINSFGSAGLTISGGDLIIQGSNSGAVTIHPQANAGTWNFNLPTIAGVSGLPLLSGGGGFAPMTWGVLGVAGGGSGLVAGISGGIPAFTGTTTLSSSGLLAQHAIVLGGGAGAVPYTLGSLGTTTTVLHGNATGDPSYAAVQNADLANSSLTIGTTSIALGATSLTLAGLTSVNKWVFTAPATAATLTAGADNQTYTLPATTDTILGRASTDTLTNKTYDTAGAGNIFKINGTAISAVTGTGSAVLATSPTLVAPTLGVASATSINKWTLTAPATAITLTGTDNQTYTLPAATDTILGRASTDTLTNKTLDSGGTGNVVKIAGAQVPAAAGSSGQYLTSQGAGTQEIFTNPCAPLAAGTGITVSGTTTCTIANTGATVSIPGPNLLCDPWLDIDQANEGASISLVTGNTYFTVDCWDVNFVSVGGATGVTAQQSLADAPPGYPASMVLTVGTGHVIGVGERLTFQQNIEGNNLSALQWGTSSGKPVQLQVWLKSNQGSAVITGALQESISPWRGTPFECPALSANTWTLCSVSIPADTTGAWTLSSTATELQVVISAACGTSAGQNGTVGVWANGTGIKMCGTTNQTNLDATSGAQLRIGPVKLEVSAAATPITRESYSADLARAQRYYEKSYNIGVVPGTASTVGAAGAYMQAGGTSGGQQTYFKVEKACTPTVVLYAPVTGTINKIYDVNNTADLNGTMLYKGMSGFFWYGTPSAGTVINLSAHWTADCRL